MNILVTGANGQLGNEMRRVAAKSPNNYILENLQWKKYIGIYFEFRRHIVGIICVLLVQGALP